MYGTQVIYILEIVWKAFTFYQEIPSKRFLKQDTIFLLFV